MKKNERHLRPGLTTMMQPGVNKGGNGDAADVGKLTKIMRQPGNSEAKSPIGNLTEIMRQPAGRGGHK